MKNKIIPIFVILIMCLSSSIYAFSDTEEHWAKEGIDFFSMHNIVKGYEDGTFRPDENLTRAEVATIVNRTLGTSKESSRFVPDIKRTDWYYSEIRKAIQSGVMQGDSEGFVHPNDAITREEAVVMIARAFAIPESAYTFQSYTDSSDVSNWAVGSVNAFTNLSYIGGYEDGTILPRGYITRAEFVTIFHRVIKNILTTGMYTDNLSGNTLVMGKGVTLKNIVINGDLIIGEGTKETLVLRNVEVKGNLILRENIEETKEITVIGNKIDLYISEEELEKYDNTKFGIMFSIPSKVTVIDKTVNEKIDYSKENMLVIDIKQDEKYYLQNVETIAKEIIRSYDNIYNASERGSIGNSPYILYDDLSKGTSHKCLVIKRDQTVYTLFFNRIIMENLVDNVLATIKLYETPNVVDRNKVIYKNNKLNLKFSYREGYIGVDDSYNTGNIYSGDAPLKLFIQVNIITDMQEYSEEEIKFLLKTLAEKDGELIDTQILKVMNYTAFKFKVQADEKIKNSLYIVMGNNLYNLIFTADEEVMNEVGEEFFMELIKSIEL